MRRIVLSAVLLSALSACISGEKGASSPDAEAAAAPAAGPQQAAAPASEAPAAPKNTGPKKVVAYFTNWAQYRKGGCAFNVSDIKPELLTNIIFSFAKVDPGPGGKAKPKFGIAPYEKTDLGPNGQYAQMMALKKKAPHLKVSLAIGGWSHNDPPTAWLFTTMAETPEGRSDFVKSTIAYVREHGFDGIDIDWEYPGDPTRGGRSVDTNNYTALLNDFRAAINAEAKASGKDPLLLTIAAPAGVAVRGYDIPKIWEPVDWINLMSYDYEGGWAKVTGHNAPAPKHGAGVQGSVSIYMNFGVPAEKIMLGMATYGRTFKDAEGEKPGLPAKGNAPPGRCTGAEGMLSYLEIKELIEQGKFKPQWDETAQVPYGYDPKTKIWLSYDDQKSFEKKLDFIDEKGLAGAMFWALDMDDFKNGYPLISTVSKRYIK